LIFEKKKAILNWCVITSMFATSQNVLSLARYGMAGNKDVRKWEMMLERYLAEDNPQQKKNLMFGLAQAQHSTLHCTNYEDYLPQKGRSMERASHQMYKTFHWLMRF